MGSIKRIDRILKYQGTIVDVYQDIMQTDDGREARWDYIAHRKGASAVVPVMDDGSILMVRQYRNALDRYTIEIPAGARNSVDEPHIDCAARELEEETGYKAGKLIPLIQTASTVAFCNEIIHIFAASELIKTRQHLDEDEFLNVERYKLSDLLDMIFAGEIQDSKTVAALMAYKVYQGR